MRSSTLDHEQAQEARIIHEVEAVRLAAMRRSPDELGALQLIIERSCAHLRQGRNLADDDEAFHLALIGAAKNPILLRIVKALYLMTHSVRRAYFEARKWCAIHQGPFEDPSDRRATRGSASR